MTAASRPAVYVAIVLQKVMGTKPGSNSSMSRGHCTGLDWREAG